MPIVAPAMPAILRKSRRLTGLLSKDVSSPASVDLSRSTIPDPPSCERLSNSQTLRACSSLTNQSPPDDYRYADKAEQVLQ
jgi:hypothetical protein